MNLAFGHKLGECLARDIAVDTDTRLRSMYVIGSSGSGKSSLLETWIHQDITDGVGFCVFDVEDRLSERVLRHLCDHCVDPDKKVVVIDPAIGITPLNVLDVPQGIHPHTVVEGVLQAFKRAWFAEWGPRLEDLLRHSLIAFVEARLTLGELTHFLSNEAWRVRVAQASQDHRVRSYFLDHLRNVPAREWRTWVESTRNKVAAFTDNPFIAPCLSTEHCLDLLDVMDTGKPLIINLSEKTLGDSGKLLGMLLVSRLFQAALRRQPGARPFIIYADEFQNLASKSFVDLVTRSRKRGVGSVLAHQTTHQPPFDKNPEFLSAILGTTAVHAVMQVGREDAERFAKEIFPTSGTEVKRRKKHWLWGDYGDPSFYSVQEEREQQMLMLEHLTKREMYLKLKDDSGTAIFVAEAYDLPEPSSSTEAGEALATASILASGSTLEEVSELQAARIARYTARRRPLRAPGQENLEE